MWTFPIYLARSWVSINFRLHLCAFVLYDECFDVFRESIQDKITHFDANLTTVHSFWSGIFMSSNISQRFFSLTSEKLFSIGRFVSKTKADTCRRCLTYGSPLACFDTFWCFSRPILAIFTFANFGGTTYTSTCFVCAGDSMCRSIDKVKWHRSWDLRKEPILF